MKVPRAVLAACSGAGERGRLSILIFHRVLATPDALLPGEMHAARFDAVLAHVARQYNVLPLRAAIERLAAGSLPSRALAITFDDGYADNLAVAAPLLARHGVPATVFVATAYLDGGCMWNDVLAHACRTTSAATLDLGSLGLGTCRVETLDERRALFDTLVGKLKYLAAEDRARRAADVARVAGVEPPGDLMLTSAAVVELERAGVEIGAHTRHHPILAVTPDADAWSEIDGSRQDLERILGHRVTLFAYPNGKPGRDYAPVHARMARDAGFAAAVSTAHGAATRASDPFELPRFTPWKTDPLPFDLMMMRNLASASRRPAA